MRDSVRLTPDKIIQSIRFRRIDETVSDPFSSLNDLGDISFKLERFLHSFIVDFHSGIESVEVGVPIVAEDVE